MFGLIVFCGAAGLTLVVSARVAQTLLRRLVARRVLHRTAAPIAGLRQDDVARVEGRIAVEGTPLLRSPIGGRPCVGYYVGVEYFDASPHRVPQWFPLMEETVVAPFRVIDEEGSVIDVDADRFDLEVHFVESGRVLSPPPERVRPLLRRSGVPRSMGGRDLAYVEVPIEPGTRVSVFGRVLRVARGGAGAYRRSTRGTELGPLRAGEPIRVVLE